MKGFSLLTLVVTDACNFTCTYCPQKKGNSFLSRNNVDRFSDFFFPRLKSECRVNFYGGEPLLAFDTIEYAVDRFKRKNKAGRKKITFSLSTNGSLLDDRIIRFLVENAFDFIVSFDGLAQEVSRKKETLERQVKMITALSDNPRAKFMVNSVYTPETAPFMAKSIAFIHGLGARNILLSLDVSHDWSAQQLAVLKRELRKIADFNFAYLKKEGRPPVINFRGTRKKGMFACFAGQDRMSIHPDGRLWGCNILRDYFQGKEQTREFRRFTFGSMSRFSHDHERIYPKILASHGGFRQDMFLTQKSRFCFLCDDLERCSACPAIAGQVTGQLGRLPDWYCQVKKSEREAIDRFRKQKIE